MARGKKSAKRKGKKGRGPTTRKIPVKDVVMKELPKSKSETKKNSKSKSAITKPKRKPIVVKAMQQTMQEVGEALLKKLPTKLKKESVFTDPVLKGINGSMYNAGFKLCGDERGQKLDENLAKAYEHANKQLDKIREAHTHGNNQLNNQLNKIREAHTRFNSTPRPCGENKGAPASEVAPRAVDDLSDLFRNF